MTAFEDLPPAPLQISLPAADVMLLAELLSHLDEFLRSPRHGPVIWQQLQAFARPPVHPDAGWTVDMVSFLAAALRKLAADADDDDDDLTEPGGGCRQPL